MSLLACLAFLADAPNTCPSHQHTERAHPIHPPARAPQALALSSVEELEGLLGGDNVAVADLRRLFELAAAYGYADWLVFDASVVRGLAYYTGARRAVGLQRQA